MTGRYVRIFLTVLLLLAVASPTFAEAFVAVRQPAHPGCRRHVLLPTARADEQTHGDLSAAGKERLPGPLFDGLGNHHHPVTAKSKLAQRYFDQGLTLLFAFNHKEAIRSFRSAAKFDPECAMAWWGVSYAHGPHVNKPMSKEDNDEAWAAFQQAFAQKSKVSPHERAYITALSKRYQAEFAEDRSALDKAYAAAMREVVKESPDDLDAQTLFAEALMDTMPWDYWLKDRSSQTGNRGSHRGPSVRDRAES